MLKALMLHSADDEGNVGPDAKFGWGILNIERAAQIIKDAKFTGKARLHTFTTNPIDNSIDELTLTGSGTSGNTPGLDPTAIFKASICWTDYPGAPQTAAEGTDPTTIRLVYNFDLSIRRPGNNLEQQYTYRPLTMANPTATVVRGNAFFLNNVDNFKQTFIAPVATTPIGNEYNLYLRKSASSPSEQRNVSAVITGLTPSSTLSTNDFDSSKTIAFYSNTDNKIKVISNDIVSIGVYCIYDINGKIVQKGAATTNEFELNFDTKGVYIAKFENTEIEKSLKFVR